MARDVEIEAHRSWLGLLQPVGLVVSAPALVAAQAVVNRNVVELQQKLLKVVRNKLEGTPGGGGAVLEDFPLFAQEVLGWMPEDLAGAAGGPELPQDLEVVLPDYGETLRPTYAVAEPEKPGSWLMLVQVLPLGMDLDDPGADEHARTGWHASPQAKLERLLRERGLAAGLLCNGTALRLVYAPRGESSGYLTFPVQALCEVPGRPLLGALHMLLEEFRVFSAPNGRRLLDLLRASRKYQNEVSTKLAEQVLGALIELLNGFQAADAAVDGRLIGAIAREDPEQVYGGLLTTLLRLVFLLYAEDRGLMPGDEVYTNHYSVTGLYERLQEEAGRYPDTMDQRYGAWAGLLSLFRLVFDGGGHGALYLPARHGQLFNPDEHPFLESRPAGVHRVKGERVEPPRVSDGCIYRVLRGLLVLDGERLSYRALDVEQIGSVYEAMMGFAVERTSGPAIGVKPHHVVVDVGELLAAKPADRSKILKEHAGCELTGNALQQLKEASTPEDLVAALGRRLSDRTPRMLAPGALYLQPGEERRRTGSHYTPRELTEPIVETTLRPVLEGLGERPSPEQILDLKVCDPAMGSGAFLVEACRQLAEKLVEAWQLHGATPAIPPDEDPLLHARRLVAQRCLYGVDKNPFAVNLAKLSLWLVTLAKDHPFTFVDHALRCGDSLVGLTREQILSADWAPGRQLTTIRSFLEPALDRAEELRVKIQTLGDLKDNREKQRLLREAEEALEDVKLVGDCVVAAFFGAENDKARRKLLAEVQEEIEAWRSGQVSRQHLAGRAHELREASPPVNPFHWEMEFPEVFSGVESAPIARGRSRSSPLSGTRGGCRPAGFDAMVGNPPYMGGTRISANLGSPYLNFLVAMTQRTTGNVDMSAFFLRRVDALTRLGGALGLITTNSVKTGDSGRASVSLLIDSGRELLCDLDEHQWPGSANVAYIRMGALKRQGGFRDPVAPKQLDVNANGSARGCDVFGVGFILPNAEAEQWLFEEPALRPVIAQYIGGAEFSSSSTLSPDRYIIDFGEMSEQEARQYARAFRRVEQQVKPARATVQQRDRRELWWLFATRAPRVRSYLREHGRVLVASQVSKHLVFGFLTEGVVISHTLNIFLVHSFAAFSALQTRTHEVWANDRASSLETRQRYTPTTCFLTFPFPENWGNHPALEEAGKVYYEFRAGLMVRNDEGLTKTYNRFHDPDERDPEILRLRELHAAMDRAVLDAYGWTDVPTDCAFLLDYEIDEETWGGKKKPYRYRWPEEVHDEVLARLLDLNQKRAEQERLAGTGTGESKSTGKGKRGRKGLPKNGTLPRLFDTDEPGAP